VEVATLVRDDEEVAVAESEALALAVLLSDVEAVAVATLVSDDDAVAEAVAVPVLLSVFDADTGVPDGEADGSSGEGLADADVVAVSVVTTVGSATGTLQAPERPWPRV